MISRRAVLTMAALQAARGQSQPASVLVVWNRLSYIPDAFARESILFPRAYFASPRADLAHRTFETGKFAHALQPGDPTLATLLGGRYRETTLGTERDILQLLKEPFRDRMIVLSNPGSEDSPRERYLRLRLAIRYPQAIRAREAPEILISHVDLAPTLLALAGVAAREGMQGRDLSALITAGRGELPDSVYVQGGLETASPWRAVIRGYDKLVVNREEQPQGMYNLADDPDEQMDLAKEPSQRLMRDGLLALTRVWMKKISDGWTPSGLRLR